MHLYLHVPFCKKACHYCDFHFVTNTSRKTEMVAGMVKELELQKDFLKQKSLKTIYFGGGTPSLLEFGDFELIFSKINSIYDLSQIEEITLEANPDDISLENIKTWKHFGVNRISLGIQTFDESALNFMNRAHTRAEAIASLEMLIAEGLPNISVDLIYSLIDQNGQLGHGVLKQDLEIIAKYNLPHVSAYNLTIENKTVLGAWKKQGKLKEVEDEYAEEQFNILTKTLKELGYEQYEVSNFAKNGAYAIHNTSYWKNKAYLGIGPSAHSYDLEKRFANVANNAKYIKVLEEGYLATQEEILSITDKVNDYILCGLRTIWGINISVLKEIAGEVPKEFYEALNEFIMNGWVTMRSQNIVITEKGRIFSDRITSSLFFE